MEKKSMTALISAFARAYHSKMNEVKVFDDCIINQLFTDKEYSNICHHMSSGIDFFNPEFEGNEEQALKWVVDHQIAPTVLARSAYAEEMLQNAVKTGTSQYVALGAGYDTFSLRQTNWPSEFQIFELDQMSTANDKVKRINNASIHIKENVNFIEVDFNEDDWSKKLANTPAFDRKVKTYCSLLGVTYYLPRDSFQNLLRSISQLLPQGSCIVFDYPDAKYYTEEADRRVQKQLALADAAGESMLEGYAYGELEKILEDSNFLIYEHLKAESITERYFSDYNSKSKLNPMSAFQNVNFCLAVIDK